MNVQPKLGAFALVAEAMSASRDVAGTAAAPLVRSFVTVVANESSSGWCRGEIAPAIKPGLAAG